MSRSPMTVPWESVIAWPLALSWKSACATPVIASGYRMPPMTATTRVMRSATASSRPNVLAIALHQMQRGDGEVAQLDPRERDDHAAESVDQEVASQQRRGTDGAV